MDIIALLNGIAGALPDPWGKWVFALMLILVLLFGIFSVIAKLTPTQSDDAFVDKIWAFIHALALNPRADKARPAKDSKPGNVSKYMSITLACMLVIAAASGCATSKAQKSVMAFEAATEALNVTADTLITLRDHNVIAEADYQDARVIYKKAVGFWKVWKVAEQQMLTLPEDSQEYEDNAAVRDQMRVAFQLVLSELRQAIVEAQESEVTE